MHFYEFENFMKILDPPNYENFCSEFSRFFPDPPSPLLGKFNRLPCSNQEGFPNSIQCVRLSLKTAHSICPIHTLWFNFSFTDRIFFFNLSEKGTFTDISLSIINICLHIQTDKKIIDVFHIRTFLWLVVDSQLSLSKALPLSWR